jgi:hypothetical protein
LFPSFFGIGFGPSGQEESAYGATMGAGNFGVSLGEQDLSSASNFWNSILSGDPTKISQVLGPAMSAANKQSQQAKMTASQFGNRSGGSNAFMQSVDDQTRGNITSMIGGLMGTGAGQLGSIGGSAFSTGSQNLATGFSEAQIMQQQRQAQLSDIFGSIAAIAGGVAGGFAGAGAGAALQGASMGAGLGRSIAGGGAGGSAAPSIFGGFGAGKGYGGSYGTFPYGPEYSEADWQAYFGTPPDSSATGLPSTQMVF